MKKKSSKTTEETQSFLPIQCCKITEKIRYEKRPNNNIKLH